MPRRVPDYPDAYYGWNNVASFGSLISSLGGLLFFYIAYITLTGKPKDKDKNKKIEDIK